MFLGDGVVDAHLAPMHRAPGGEKESVLTWRLIGISALRRLTDNNGSENHDP
jgi:hypothetical protein